MSSDIVVPVIVYLTLFRLGIIAAGIISIFLGYRLFCRGVWPDSSNGNGTTVDAEIAGQRFTLKNAAPGTCFALFGVIIISVMFASGPPELSQEIASPQKDQKAQKGSGFRLRGSGEMASPAWDVLQAQLKEAAQAYRQGDFKGADVLFENLQAGFAGSRDFLALLNNEWAVRYLEESRFDLAAQKSRLAVTLVPEDDDFIDTYVVAMCKSQNPSDSLGQLADLAGPNSSAHMELRKLLEAGRCP